MPPAPVLLPQQAPRKGMETPSKDVQTATRRTTRAAPWPETYGACLIHHLWRCATIPGVVEPFLALWRPVPTRHHHVNSSATEALPSARPWNQHGRNLESAYERRPDANTSQHHPRSHLRTSTGVATPPVEAGIHHQTAPKARIRQDNYHTMNIVRQYIANVHNTAQHACKVPPLGL
jgi:hypothetical protein